MELMLLNIGYSDLQANWNWKKVYSPFARIYYVSGGRANVYIEGVQHKLRPQHLYMVPPFTLHDDECDDTFSSYYIHFYESMANNESVFDRFTFPFELEASALDLVIIRRLQEINPDAYLRFIDPQIYDNEPTFSRYVSDSRKMPSHVLMETEGVLFQLLSRFMEGRKEKVGSGDARINKCLQYIHENIDKEISLEHLADISCITKDHFIRIFKKEMHCTPLKYILSKKIERAQLLLITTDKAIRDIALDLSIDNTSYFNRLFKASVGKTPSEYRINNNKYTKE